ncbi:type II secretion system protein N [Cognatazoarcus halotolerans]|uniref:type II secretion system protein N n=1 Tax=Cognatazoarcus halotolerans TaxID=2686016 RepID=UPI001358D6CF|nr:type II secretion system protein N [Cognatazoarcus halotolerans]
MTSPTGQALSRLLASSAIRRTMPALAWLAALCFTAWVTATLFWRFSAPDDAALPLKTDTDPRAAAQRIIGQQLLGGKDRLAADRPALAPSLPIEVVGLATGFVGGSGFVMLRTGGKLSTYAVGDEISPGRRLKRILADRIEIERGGSTEEIRLPVTPVSGILPAGVAAEPSDVQPRASENAARAALSDTEEN